ncbi:MAG TPA: hypothetical protein ACYCC0_01395, partial [Candidatus Azoamicus sp.]
ENIDGYLYVNIFIFCKIIGRSSNKFASCLNIIGNIIVNINMNDAKKSEYVIKKDIEVDIFILVSNFCILYKK